MTDVKIENNRFLEVEKIAKEISNLAGKFSEDIMSIYEDYDPDAGTDSIAICFLIIADIKALIGDISFLQNELLNKGREMRRESRND